jgi:hypothetical protein
MNQTQKTEWITELAALRYKILMRNYNGTPYKSAADEWREKWELRKLAMRKKMIVEEIL